MATRTTVSLHQTLLYFLSLVAISLATNEDVIRNSHSDPSQVPRVLLTGTVSYNGHENHPMPTHGKWSLDISDALPNPLQLNLACQPNQKQCNDTCIDSAHECCAASERCLPGDYCYHHSGAVRCCPKGLACFQISGDVCFERTVVWYEEVHIVDENEDKITTPWDLMESVYTTSSRITVTASYPGEGRASFRSLSGGILEVAATPMSLALDEIPTRTVTTMATHTMEPMLPDPWSGVEGQVVLDL
ncbi:hypothetical protein BDW66DRAFT_164789 [Aspergillus desertorum]